MKRSGPQGTFCNSIRVAAVSMFLAVGFVPAFGFTQNSPIPDDLKAGVLAANESFMKAFNQHDAKAVAALWKTDGVHFNQTDGTKLAGRQAIEDAYTKLFQADPQATITIDINGFRAATGETVTAEGTSSVKHTDGTVSDSRFDAVLAKEDGQWLISQVNEAELPTVITAAQALKELSWFIGHWIDTSTDVHVFNDVKWVPGGNFITRKYRQEVKGETVREGTQVIGWDAEHRQLRSWVFDSNGSFGDGVWQRDGERKWLCRQVLKLPDGRRASFTQILERTGEDKLSVLTTAVEVDGEAMAGSGPHTLIRQSEPTETK